MTSKETFYLPEFGQVQSNQVLRVGIILGVKYQQIMSDPDRLAALDQESLKELRKVTDMLREG